jgi:tRNA pseudouridine38-40 synthase
MSTSGAEQRNLKLLLSYDGTDFHGWQTQTGFRTVQETLEQAIAVITGEKVFANASGRTDTGVHALGQVVNFRSRTRHVPRILMRAINAHLPPDVIVRAAEEVHPEFDACRHAVGKWYRYVLHDGPVPDVFLRRYACHIPYRLDVEAMNRAAHPLLGQHDFHSFETEWPNRKSSIRTITHLSVTRPRPAEDHRAEGEGSLSATGKVQTRSHPDFPLPPSGAYIWIDIEADGFLYNMVRSIAGTLLNVGRGYWPDDQVATILAAEDRRRAGPTAPAHGLFLMQVNYDQP